MPISLAGKIPLLEAVLKTLIIASEVYNGRSFPLLCASGVGHMRPDARSDETWSFAESAYWSPVN